MTDEQFKQLSHWLDSVAALFWGTIVLGFAAVVLAIVFH